MDGATTIFAFLGQTTDLILQHTNMGTTNLCFASALAVRVPGAALQYCCMVD
jgi:hypothetical protein